MKTRWNPTGAAAAAAVLAMAAFALVIPGVPAGGLGPAVAGGAVVELKGTTDKGVELAFAPPDGKAGTFDGELYDLSGKLLAKASRDHGGKAFNVTFQAAVDAKDLANYYVQYRFAAAEAFARRSLFFMQELLSTTVLGQRDLVGGTSPRIRVLVQDKAAGAPVAAASVSVTLAEKDKPIASFEGRTDERGEVVAALKLPDREINGAKLSVKVKSRTSADAVEERVNVKSATRTLLTTDKPLYQPGQTIHMRALSLNRATMKPRAEAPVVFEVEDAKGNKVFKKPVTADRFGISHTDFVLADELNKGTFRIRAIVAGAREEKTVTVDRYVLPKFKAVFATDRKFYQPGETVKADLQVDYFFGKPVAGGKVKVTCFSFDVAYKEFHTVEAVTDAKGHYRFEVKLPTHFVGQPLEAGKASAKFDVSVTDTADHKEQITRNVPVTANPILVAAVPEGGRLIPGLANRIYVVTTYADASPARCKVTWANPPDGKAVTIETDDAGFGQLTLTPPPGKDVSMELQARDAKGSAGASAVTLKRTDQAGDAYVLLRTDRTLYKVGDRVAVHVAATRKTGTVYVDVIKDRQTHLTRTLELADGQAATKIDLDAGLAGTLQVNAYLLSANGVMVRDRRLVVVDPANDLRIAVVNGAETYLPAQEATVKFRVTDAAGRGVPAALCVMVVDEAVFALQEMQPGLEKIYFYLEKEIAKPRYEIHGWDLNGVLPPADPLLPAPGPIARRDKAAQVLLASAEGVGKYALHVDTFQHQNKQAAFLGKMMQATASRYGPVNAALNKQQQDLRKAKKKLPKGSTLADLVAAGYLKKQDCIDPWGSEMKLAGNWCASCQTYHGFRLESAGIDGKWGTADDVTQALWQAMARRRGGFAPNQNKLAAAGGAVALDAAGGVGEPVPLPAPAAMPVMSKSKAGDAPEEGAGSSGAAASPVRVREYFPETLLFRPAVITDAGGLATLTFPLADSITTWRLTSMASSGTGQLGSATGGIRVFQDFFVDVDFPVSLTQNDQVWVPVAVYNYLKTDQAVRLTVKPADWYELRGESEVTVKLGPSEVKGVHFPIVVRRIGFHRFTVVARGSAKSDAVARSVEVVPDGNEFRLSASGRLTKDVAHTIAIPAGAIDEASKIFVKVYPGVLSQVVEGLDSMLRMPSGCFEQTSSANYPNVLAMDYMKTAGKITPAIQMKAEGFINAGYQRLVSYECPGGGFDWFGRPPAHRILTAFGLMEFHDMSKVHEVDPQLIVRTQQWLARCQEKDGSYKPSAGGIREGAIDKFTDDVFRNTAYITWALASTGADTGAVEKGIKYLRAHLDEMKDTYTIALTANAFAAVEPKGKTTALVVQTLLDKATTEGETTCWRAAGDTPTHGRGETADIETTGLAVQALVRAGRSLDVAGRAVTYLVGKKDSFGTWQSTQATIQALRAMITAERDATRKTTASIAVTINGKAVRTLQVTEANSDVMQLVDLKELTRKGDNEVKLGFAGEGGLMYQVVGRYFLPQPKEAQPPAGPLSIDVKYDRTTLAADDVIGVTATVRNNRGGRAQMVLVDLGLPPGFTLLSQKLQKMVADGKIEKFAPTGRQLIVYLREVDAAQPVVLEYELLAKYPLKAKTPKAVAYEYYNPKVRGEAAPIQLVVNK